tara:strand:+ start:3716 stop:5125 length:1410 start_codon:yes stop_codon:yes gene_type:complete
MWNFYKFKSNVALSDGNEDVYYSDLIKYSKKIVNKLRKKSLTVILVNNSISSLVCYISLLKKRFPILILDERVSKKNLNKIIKLYEPENICLSTHNSYLKNNNNFKLNFFFKNFQFLKTIKKNNFKVKNNLSVLATTSGSTGSAKLVRQSYDNIQSNTYSIIKYLKIKYDNVTITSLPLSYTFGMSVINTHLEIGSKIIVTNKSIIEKKFWEIFSKEQVNTVYGVPYTFEILNKLNFFSRDAKNLKLLAQAGGKISENLQKKISTYAKKYQKLFFIMYGQAEATTRISYLPYKKFDKKIGSIGIPIPGGKIRLVDEKRRVIKNSNKIGEIVYEGKNVCMGYALDKDDINKKNEWRNRIYTGDLAKRDREGYYYIVGRKKRFSKIYGLSVNLDEIENLLKSKFNNYNFAVISKKNKIQIFLNAIGINDSVINFLKRNTLIHINSYEIILVKEIPTLSNGKNNYKVLSDYS